MSKTEVFQVRTEEAPLLPAPISTTGVIGWMRQNLFSSIGNTFLTLIGVLLAYSMLAPFIQFAFIDAVWTGDNREACLPQDGGHSGACWAYVEAYFPQFIYGRYPVEERYRVDIVYALFALLLVPLAIPCRDCSLGRSAGDAGHRGDRYRGVAAAGHPAGARAPFQDADRQAVLDHLHRVLARRAADHRAVHVVGDAAAVPAGRRDLRQAAAGADRRALFSSAYMAEVVRGGLQAIPKGQYEGAMALGLSFWQMMR
jgi:hypothetical protein